VSDNKEVFIFGYSGHAYVIIESLLDAGYKIIGYFDSREAIKNPYHLEYFGYEKEVNLNKIVGKNLVFPCVGDNLVRKRLIELFEKLDLNQFVVKDPTAKVSSSVSVKMSTYIGKSVIVNAQSIIGKGVILNTSCIVEHECLISDFTHLAPGVVLCGNVTVFENNFVGANTVVRNNLIINADNVIGAGSVVVKDIQEVGIWVGNNLRKL
jgi:UDP-N-acetylbacillosamine N-acetyltransferase